MTGNFPDYLSSVKSLVAEVEVQQNLERNFSSLVAGARFGEALIVGVSSDPVRIMRSEACILADEKSYYFFAFVTKGRGEMRHNGRHCALTPTQFTVGDMALPHATSYLKPSSRLLVCIQRNELAIRCANIERSLGTGILANNGIGRITARYFADLFNERHLLSEEEKAVAMEAGIDLLLSNLRATKLDARSELLPAFGRSAAALARAKAVIVENLRDPELSPAVIAALSGISVRYLHRVFETTGVSVTSWLRSQRLKRCYSDLTDDKMRHLTIMDIAFSWGFNESSHFSRVFADQFGITARQVRQQH